MARFRISYRLSKRSDSLNKARIVTAWERGLPRADLREMNVTIEAATPAEAYRRLREIVLPGDVRPISGKQLVRYLKLPRVA